MQKFIILLLFPLLLSSQIIDSLTLHEASWSTYDVQDFYWWSGLQSYVGEVNYGVNAYSVVYMTPNEDGELVQASGAIFLPIGPTCPMPVLSWQHGTVVADEGAPSKSINSSYNTLSSTQTIGFVAASHGYIVFMSDYLGLGDGEGFHNYCHSDTEASAVIDLIIYGKEFASSLPFNSVQANDQLFLMGYSQGGHATMAAVKEIEENYSNQLSITASAPMAGPYSMSEAQAEMINTVYPNPGYFPYVIFAYDNVYGDIYSSVEEVLKPGFSDLFSWYDGTKSMTEINDTILEIAQEMYNIDASSFTPMDMVQNDYYEAYQNNNNHPFQLALEANDLIDFIPNSPMRIMHCSGDNDVAFENAVMAYDSFSLAEAEEITLVDGGNYDHGQCASMSIIAAKLFFDTKANFCNETNIMESTQVRDIVKSFDVLGRPISTLSTYNFIVEFHKDGSAQKKIISF